MTTREIDVQTFLNMLEDKNIDKKIIFNISFENFCEYVNKLQVKKEDIYIQCYIKTFGNNIELRFFADNINNVNHPSFKDDWECYNYHFESSSDIEYGKLPIESKALVDDWIEKLYMCFELSISGNNFIIKCEDYNIDELLNLFDD